MMKRYKSKTKRYAAKSCLFFQSQVHCLATTLLIQREKGQQGIVMGHDQEVVKQLQRRLKNWNPNKRCKSHPADTCCEYTYEGRLWALHLCNVDLEELPSELWQISSLELLTLSYNQFSTLPAEIGQIASLKYLDVSHNRLNTLPAEFGNLSALTDLFLSNNRLRTLPVEFGNLSVLERLDLNNNLLSTLPAELGNLSDLRELSLSSNQLKTLPAELENCSALWHLNLHFNPLPKYSGIWDVDSFASHERILSYLHDDLPKQPSHQLVTSPSPSENAFVEPYAPEISGGKGTRSTQEALPLKIFYCYAHEDKDLRDRIDKHLGTLKRLGHVIGWYDREIQAGTEWEREIETHLSTASVILLLVSADFVNSDYCYGVEMQKALKMHEKGEARVLPILLRPVDWQDSPFAKLQILPTGAKPITKWTDPEEALEDVAKQIRAVVATLRTSQN
jgi:TIR domain/Leucine rich repeat